jgi:hypothetical protein
VELVGGPTGHGKVVRGGCLFAWTFSVTSSVLMEVEERTRANMKLI